MVLDASASFTYDDKPLEKFRWSQVSGPTKVKFSNSNDAAPSISGHVAGTYVFELRVGDMEPKQITVQVCQLRREWSSAVPVRAEPANGYSFN